MSKKEIRIPESEVASLLEEVRMELAAFTKAEDKDPKDKPKEDKDPSAELAPESEAPKDPVAPDATPAVAADPVDDSAMADPDAMDPTASAEAIAPDAEMDPAAGAIEPAPTVAELQAEYEKLSDEELAMHLMAAKAAATSRNSAAAPPMAAPLAPANPMPPAAAPVPGPDDTAAAAFKSEIKKSLELELKVKELEALSVKQAKALEDLTGFVAKPFRKSAQFISEIETPVPPVSSKKLSKAEVTEKLLKVTSDASLKKSDRELINDYYNGYVKVEKLDHLLK